MKMKIIVGIHAPMDTGREEFTYVTSSVDSLPDSFGTMLLQHSAANILSALWQNGGMLQHAAEESQLIQSARQNQVDLIFLYEEWLGSWEVMSLSHQFPKDGVWVPLSWVTAPVSEEEKGDETV